MVGVDITAGLSDTTDYTRGVDIMVRANAIKDTTLVGHLRRFADFLIEPDVKSVHWADFGAWPQCIEAGELAGEAALPEIRRLLRRERILSILRPGFGKRIARLHRKSIRTALCVE